MLCDVTGIGMSIVAEPDSVCVDPEAMVIVSSWDITCERSTCEVLWYYKGSGFKI